MTRFFAPPHKILLGETQAFLKTAEIEVASATMTKKPEGHELVEGDYRKVLVAKSNGTFITRFRLAYVVDRPEIVYEGADLAKAVEAYNELE